MAVTSGTRFGSYEVTDAIGVGGMGEVYRAKDTNLKRDVAIKVLPPAFADDAQRVARFQREAEALAALNHPNIAQIYGLEKADGRIVIVMELVEGPTLADRIAQGPIPYDEALGVAMQVADALEAAHGRGIVHRDLKPANVKARPDGTVKVLDFGIATAPESPLATSGQRSPMLLTPALTEIGVLLGTAAYMAPEQARGKPVDARADIWAFGCLLYEMLTGQPVFAGEDVTTTLARVLERDADLRALPESVPPAVRHTLKLCLEKNLKKRIADIRDVRLALEGAFDSGLLEGGRSGDARPAWRRALPNAAALLSGGALVALAGVILRPEPPAAPPVMRFLVTPPAEAPLASLGGFDIAISPDGTRLAYVGEAGANEVALYVRDIDGLEARLLPGTSVSAVGGSVNPFFSADGTWIGFLAEEVGLMRVPVTGGPVVKLADMDASFRGAVVARDGTLIYATAGGLFRVAARGAGEPEQLTPDRQVTDSLLYGPVLLPGERGLLLSLQRSNLARSVVAFDLTTRELKVLIEDASNPTYAPTGHLVFLRGTTLIMAVPFDADRLAVTGEPVALVPDVRAFDYALSASGTLVYVPETDAPVGRSAIVWVDREGRVAERPPIEPVVEPRHPRVSPDGRRLALTITPAGFTEIWIFDLGGRPAFPLAADSDSYSQFSVWSPDGTKVAYASTRGSGANLRPYVSPADGSVLELVPLRSDDLAAVPRAWSADGDLILLRLNPRNFSDIDIVAVPAEADGPVRDVVVTGDVEGDAALAPNGRWLAYASDRTGGFEIWVTRYPDGVPVRVSAGGGLEPVWSRDGRELFYLQGRSLMAVAVETTGTDFSFAAAVELFGSPYFIGDGAGSYDVGPDGRFLMIEPPERAGDAAVPASIVVVENWLEELKRLVPTR
jgi:serine/threonine-protein kinase